MSDLFTHTILACLGDHLQLGDLFRLQHALGKLWSQDDAWPHDLARLFSSHLKYKRPRTWNGLRIAMQSSKVRCASCGVRCRSSPLVCVSCRSDPSDYFAMVSRAYVLQRYRAEKHLSSRGLRARLHKLRVVKKAHMGAHLLWKHEVDATFLAARLPA